MILVPLSLPPFLVYRLKASFKLTDPVTATHTLIKGTTQTGKQGNSLLTTDALNTGI